ncbi:sulfite oxidase [Parendozoicomonas haliclonae]|uniref:TMAO/DMSO reductase n=1 Tax=Parendozoicomonas haliclonae TaxID=1960125 RepID=A0A1X7AFV7_9GAMM|nr:sulfite oxidase [Parendozoicomonas haliclonae]SMA38729.1 TMAO/DMSO reductase [Parendozoicomonas haliclonae]
MDSKRRSLMQGLLAVSSVSLLPAHWVFAANKPKELEALDISALTWKSVEELPNHIQVLGSQPINAQPAEHLLDPLVTPAEIAFIRWNGQLPDFEAIDPKSWTFTVDGESCKKPQTFTIDELKKTFPSHTRQLTIECGGNGRSEFHPGTKGNQWTQAAVFCAEWTGVKVKDVLNHCGIKEDAVYTGHHSADKHLSGEGEALSRGVPIAAALNDDALIAWTMNGQPIPYMHGYPLRIVFGGRPGSVSSKAATGISIRNQIHDGAKMEAPAYHLPKYPIAPGEKVNKEDYAIIEEMIVKSLITYPPTGTQYKKGEPLTVRGHAWAGMRDVTQVDISYDYGATWHPAKLTRPENKTAWQHWQAGLQLPLPGYYEIWARATDDQGVSQPVVQPQWNPKGYMFNGCHRIAVRVV